MKIYPKVYKLCQSEFLIFARNQKSHKYIAKDFKMFAKVVEFRLIWSHWFCILSVAAAAASVGLNLLNNRKRRKNSRNQRTMKKKKRTNWTFQFLKLTSFDAVVVKGTTVGPIEPPAAALALDNNNISNNS